MRVRNPGRFAIYPSVGSGILVTCGYEECEWRFNFFPTRTDAIVVPVILENVLDEINLHMTKVH